MVGFKLIVFMNILLPAVLLGHCGSDSMVVEFTPTYAISSYHHYSCEFESRSWRDVLDTTLRDKVCQ